MSSGTASRIGALIAATIGVCGSASASSSSLSWRDRSYGLEGPLFSAATHGQRWIAGGRGVAFVSEDAGRSWRRWSIAGARGHGARAKAERREGRAPGEKRARGGDGDDAPRGFAATARGSFRYAGDATREATAAASAGREETLRRGAGGDPEKTRRKGGPRVDRGSLVHAALTRALACVASERELFCGAVESRGRRPMRRVHVGAAKKIYALTAFATGTGTGTELIAIATDAGLFTFTPSQPLPRRVPLADPPIDLATDDRGSLVVRTARFLHFPFSPRAAIPLPYPLALPTPKTRRRLPRGLASRNGDLYVAAPHALYRHESPYFIERPAPPGVLKQLVSCGKTLAARTTSGVFHFAPFGWTRAAPGFSASSLACASGRLVLVGDGEILVDAGSARAETSRALPPHALSEPPVPPRWPRFARRARFAPFAPELVVSGRLVRGLDGRAPLTDVLWPSLSGSSPRWLYDPVLRVRAAQRIEFWLRLRWPFGSATSERSIHEARREERRLARRWRGLRRRAFALWRRARRARSPLGARDHRDRARLLHQQLRRAELDALLRIFASNFGRTS